tara:strand:- start:420 stop:695 length:276 start_codon:yes stop_codon:yes gene_type:complete
VCWELYREDKQDRLYSWKTLERCKTVYKRSQNNKPLKPKKPSKKRRRVSVEEKRKKVKLLTEDMLQKAKCDDIKTLQSALTSAVEVLSTLF